LVTRNTPYTSRSPAIAFGFDRENQKEDEMGLLDILNGMQNGPRGQRLPGSSGSSGGGMSPIMMALLGVLAYKALKGGGLGNILGGGQSSPDAGRQPPLQRADVNPGASGGGLGDLLGGLFGGRPGAGFDSLPGGLGGLLGGAAAGSVLSGGLGKLIQDLQASGQGRTAQSWVSSGPNQDIAPGGLANALGADTLDALSQQTGLGREDLLAGLSETLPDFVDQLTPDGRLPTDQEASQLV
jgi:uncharacterized protein YidB (DUF937 family)